MAFPTTVTAEHTAAVRATDEVKAAEFVQRVNLIKDICSYISGEANMRARRLVDLQGSLFDHKSFIQTQSLNTAGSRQVIADNYPQYTTAAEVLTDIQSANQAFNSLTAEIETVLSAIRAAGQYVDTNPTTGEKTEVIIPEASMTALRALASSVQAQLG